MLPDVGVAHILRPSARIDEQDLAERIEGQITRRAGAQVRDLHVLRVEDRIILRGRSRTYHAKQLAQEAALELTEAHLALTNEIEVW